MEHHGANPPSAGFGGDQGMHRRHGAATLDLAGQGGFKIGDGGVRRRAEDRAQDRRLAVG
jgi:hypothetical protein